TLALTAEGDRFTVSFDGKALLSAEDETFADIAVDTSFLVFRNEQQQEYLGARTSVLGVDRNFDLARDYYVNFREVNTQAPQIVLSMPLLVTAGTARPPGPQEVLVASGVADYVGVQPGAEAIVEFVYSGAGEPIVQR